MDNTFSQRPKGKVQGMPTEDLKVWAVAFLKSGSPGAVLRFLERRRSDITPATLFLSDALSPGGWRVLPGDRDFLMAQVAPISQAFVSGVYLLYRETTAWGWELWENGEEKNRFEYDLPQSPETFSQRLLTSGVALFKGRPVEEAPLAWARQRGAPLARIPGIVPGSRPVPIIEYQTVAGLDQRKLLVETRPCLYRFLSVSEQATSPRQG
jgi:hypothetical protein